MNPKQEKLVRIHSCGIISDANSDFQRTSQSLDYERRKGKSMITSILPKKFCFVFFHVHQDKSLLPSNVKSMLKPSDLIPRFLVLCFFFYIMAPQII